MILQLYIYVFSSSQENVLQLVNLSNHFTRPKTETKRNDIAL